VTIKATATRAEKKIHKTIANWNAYSNKRLTRVHIIAKDYDALEATNKLNSFGVELIRMEE